MIARRFLLVLPCLGLLSGCDALKAGSCRTNAQCGPYRVCDVRTGQCLCNDDRACGDGEFCNTAQQCQVIAGCQDNSDCEALGSGTPLICNVKMGQCITADMCVDDAHCPFGKICDTEAQTCVPGCMDEADCPLGSGCVRAVGTEVFGRCQRGACTTSQQCRPGANCDLTTHTCVVDNRGPFCGGCQYFDPYNPQCGDPANYCLVDTGDPSRQGHYCGVDCWSGQGCPNGYVCRDVIIVGPPATPACNFEDCVGGVCTVTGGSCGNALDCPNGPPRGDCERAHVGICAGSLDQQCRNDGDCGGAPGSCRFAQCRIRESAAYGFCTCVVDHDCPKDNCRGADLSDPEHPVLGRCVLSGHRCYEEADCDTIACVNGGCLIGRNCKPDADRRCADLQQSGTVTR